jgi:hypothetical protein
LRQPKAKKEDTMSQTGHLTLTSTNPDQFRASGEDRHLRRWLGEARPDMTGEARRQVGHYARKLLGLLGQEVPALVRGAPEGIRARIDALDLAACGLPGYTRRHLLRAGMALHCAVHDRDGDTARRLMDRRKPQLKRGRPAAAQAPDRPASEQQAVEQQAVDDLVERALARASDDDSPAETAGAGRAPALARLPEHVRAVVEAANHQITAQVSLDEPVDVRGAVRAVLSTLSPEARVRVAVDLPYAADLPVVVPSGAAAPTLGGLAVEAAAAAIEHYYADVRPA